MRVLRTTCSEGVLEQLFEDADRPDVCGAAIHVVLVAPDLISGGNALGLAKHIIRAACNELSVAAVAALALVCAALLASLCAFWYCS